MKTLSQEESLRLDTLQQYEETGAASDPELDEITALAAEICNTPIAGLSLVGENAISFHSRVGPGPNWMPRGHAPCERCIRSRGLYEVRDARVHPDFRPGGIVDGGRELRFYAGVPLLAPSNIVIGCLFVQDAMPHQLTGTQKRALQLLSRQVVQHFELSRRAQWMDEDELARQRVETALTVERNFVSTVLDTVGALVAVFDTAGRIVRFNRACEQTSGYSFASLVGRYIWETLIPAEDVDESIADFGRLCSGEFPASFENFWQHRDGSLRHIAWSATALLDPQGHVTFIIATGVDVTEQRAGEATLQESEARYRQLVEGSLGMVCTHDLAGNLLSVNTHGAKSLGRTVEEMTGVDLASFLPKSGRAGFGRYLQQIADTGEAQGRMHICHRDGDLRVIAFRNKLIEVPERPDYVLGFGVDITEQVRAQEKLRNLIHQSDSILESVGEGIFAIDLAGRVTLMNPAGASMLGYTPDELLGRSLHALIHHTRADGSPNREVDCNILNSVRNRDTVRIADEVFWHKNGTSFPVEYVARPQIDFDANAPEGKPIGVVVAFTDTTDRRALDRMQDEFVSTVSHELRTPLTSLRAALGLVTGGALETRPEKKKAMLEIAIGNTDRLIRLVNDILDIERMRSGHSDLHCAVCPATALLERAASLQQAAALRTGIRFAIDAGDIEVWGDPDRLLQTLANLISNAIKFSPAGGEIRLSAHLLNEREAQFDISDSGRGIPADKLERIFERFQQVDASDSRAMGGTGLGLAICRSIVEQHGGRIWSSSPPGQGASFHFTLPTKPSGPVR